jgi:hypothetical protein
MMAKPDISVHEGNAKKVESDILLLMYQQSSFRDENVSNALFTDGLCSWDEIEPAPGDFSLVDTQGHFAPKMVMFVGAPRFNAFGYPEMLEFAHDALSIINDKRLPARRITTTFHGAGYGMDTEEGLRHLIEGFEFAYDDDTASLPQEIVFVERDSRRARMLKEHLERFTQINQPKQQVLSERTEHMKFDDRRDAGTSSQQEKPHVFVAMPFSEEFEDCYEFGVYAAVRECGFICEHVGQAAFTGDVLERIRHRISTAALVIADLTTARPNVYLEVGFAWGKNRNVIFLAREGETLHFDVSTHRCIYYRNIKHLKNQLVELLRGLNLPIEEA